MITTKSDQISKLRVIPVFGDLAMSVQFFKSGIMKQVYNGEKQAFWSIFLWTIKVKIEMLASLSRMIFRYNHGRHTTGIFLSIWTLSMLVAMNTGSLTGYAISFIPFGAPILLINMEWSSFLNIIWYGVESKFIAYWGLLFLLFQAIHVVRIYFEIGNTTDHMKRGSSWIMSLIGRNKYFSEFQIQCFVEPILIASLGYITWEITGDIAFVILAFASGICLFLQECADGSFRYYHSRF